MMEASDRGSKTPIKNILLLRCRESGRLNTKRATGMSYPNNASNIQRHVPHDTREQLQDPSPMIGCVEKSIQKQSDSSTFDYFTWVCNLSGGGFKHARLAISPQAAAEHDIAPATKGGRSSSNGNPKAPNNARPRNRSKRRRKDKDG